MTTYWQEPSPTGNGLNNNNNHTLNNTLNNSNANMNHSGSANDASRKKLLSTSSPEGIQVASKITPTRLANLLIRKGPLPIRHITAQLALEVPSFDFLSLSKQRRLIMAAMEQTDVSNNVVFEKIGWGQWAVRKIDSDFIVTEGTDGTDGPDAMDDADDKKINVNDLRVQNRTKKATAATAAAAVRRESITNNKTNLHNLKLPQEPDSNAIASDSEDEYDKMIDEDDEEDDDDDEEEEEEDELFTFDQDESINKFKRSPPIKFAKRVPLKISPPPTSEPGPAFRRRKSSSSNPNSSISKIPSNYRHQILNRSRLNSMDNLDSYIMSSQKNSNVSISSPPPPQYPNQYYSSASAANSVLSASPVNSWNGNNNYIHHSGATSPDSIAATMKTTSRRKSSFNESHIRSTLSSSLPHNNTPQIPQVIPPLPQTPTIASATLSTLPSNSPKIANLLNKPYENEYLSNSTPTVAQEKPQEFHVRGYSASAGVDQASDTDEEDWAKIGAESLRKNQAKLKNRTPRSPTRPISHQNNHPRYRSGSRRSSVTGATKIKIEVNEEERSAAFALVDLRSV